MKALAQWIGVLGACAALASPRIASAQAWLIEGVAAASSGLEGGGGRVRSTGRAPTRLRVGADLRVDESPDDVFGAALLLAIEPRTSFGLDARYTRLVHRFALSGGAIGYFQPGSLVGAVAGCEYRLPLAGAFAVSAGPELDVFVVGTDLPDRTVLWQALFHLGFRVSL